MSDLSNKTKLLHELLRNLTIVASLYSEHYDHINHARAIGSVLTTQLNDDIDMIQFHSMHSMNETALKFSTTVLENEIKEVKADNSLLAMAIKTREA